MWLFGEVLLLLWERKLYKRGNIRENKIAFNSKLPCPSTLTQQISWAKNISRLYGAKRKNIPSSASPPSLRQHTRTDMFTHTAHVDVSSDENDLQFKSTDLPGGCCKWPANILLFWWSQSRGGRADWLTHCCRCLQKGTSGYLLVRRTLQTAPSPSRLWKLSLPKPKKNPGGNFSPVQTGLEGWEWCRPDNLCNPAIQILLLFWQSWRMIWMWTMLQGTRNM